MVANLAVPSELIRMIEVLDLPAGSILVVNGGTWHCGGANTSDDDWRLGLNIQYCQGWMRQQQNQ